MSSGIAWPTAAKLARLRDAGIVSNSVIANRLLAIGVLMLVLIAMPPVLRECLSAWVASVKSGAFIAVPGELLLILFLPCLAYCVPLVLSALLQTGFLFNSSLVFRRGRERVGILGLTISLFVGFIWAGIAFLGGYLILVYSWPVLFGALQMPQPDMSAGMRTETFSNLGARLHGFRPFVGMLAAGCIVISIVMALSARLVFLVRHRMTHAELMIEARD